MTVQYWTAARLPRHHHRTRPTTTHRRS